MKSFLRVWVGISFAAIGFGIAILVLAVASGASWKDIETYSITESYEGVENIDFDIPYGEVNIIEGDTFSIDADNLIENDLESYVSDGTWYIQDGDSDNFNIFGIHLSLGQITNWDGDFTPEITITIPRGFTAGDYNLIVGAGNVEADAIRALNGNFEVQAGRLYIKELNMSEKSTYNVGAGEMVLQDVTIHDITLDCGVGNVQIAGLVTGDNEISCGVGKVELDIEGSGDDYSYDISAGIGNVEIDGNSYHDLDKRIDNGSGNNLTLDCGIGNITVDFN